MGFSFISGVGLGLWYLMPLATIFQLNHGVQFYQWSRVRTMVFNATFNNISAISWRSDLLVEETGVPGENHRPAESKR